MNIKSCRRIFFVFACYSVQLHSMYVVQFSVANFKDSRFKFVNFYKSNFALEYVFEFLPGY